MNNEYLRFSSQQELFDKVIQEFLMENPIPLENNSMFIRFFNLGRSSIGHFTQYLGENLPFITSLAVAASGRNSYTSLGYTLALYPAVQLLKLGQKIKGIKELNTLNFLNSDGAFSIDMYEEFNSSLMKEVTLIETKINKKIFR